MEPTAACAPRQLDCVDPIPWRDEVIRPLGLFADRTATQRAQETATHPDTVRTLQRRFHRQGMLGLIPTHLKVTPRGRAARVPDAVRQEIDRLKALYAGFHDREFARSLFFTVGYPIHTTRSSSCGSRVPSWRPSSRHSRTITDISIPPTPAGTCSDSPIKAGTR